MKISSNGKIEFVRGDDDTLIVALTDGSSFTTGDRVYFCVKSDPANSVSDILEIVSTEFVTHMVDVAGVPTEIEKAAAVIDFVHVDTVNIALGTYYYDIWIGWGDGTFVTLVKPTAFKMTAGGSHGSVST